MHFSKRNRWLLITLSFVLALVLFFFLYGRKTYPVEFGLSFNVNEAAKLNNGDWQTVYLSVLKELKPKYIRVATLWSDIEEKPDVFDFSDVDWMMDRAAEHDVKVLLTIGQKSPRWPECYIPRFLSSATVEDRRKELFVYLETMVARYHGHPALEIWQVENEPFLPAKFGECDLFDRKIVLAEIELVKKLDPAHPILVTDSGELSTWRKASRAGDLFGTTIYRVVRTPQGWRVNYKLLSAGFLKLKSQIYGLDYNHFFVSELQAEPWFGADSPFTITREKSEETMNPERLQSHIDFSTHLGASRVYLWGTEWWYFMKEQRDDARYWEVVKKKILE